MHFQPSPLPPRAEGEFDAHAAVPAAIDRLSAAARHRLESRARLNSRPVTHYRRPPERPFLAHEREHVTILFGGLSGKHDRLVQAAFESCGYRAQALPQPDLAACHVGRQFCNNGLCNPAYFTIGNLIRHLQHLESTGLTRQQIVEHFVFFTAGACGPCRFGMYESEYRLALAHAGFAGFRVLLFQQEHGVKADTGEPGLKLTLHFGLGALNALMFADALQAFGYEVRPYEMSVGQTDRQLAGALEETAFRLASRPEPRPLEQLPQWILKMFGERRSGILLKIYEHLYGKATADTVRACCAVLEDIEVDRLRVKPVVKVTGEFWAQTTEGDGNFGMFSFLEREGAHVLVEPVGGWLLYLLHYARVRNMERRGLHSSDQTSIMGRLAARVREQRSVYGRSLLLDLSERLFRGRYDRLRHALGIPHPLLDQRELAHVAEPFYRQLARGGEGHLEVGKNIYYTTRQAAHMVLSLKPFGCMPSTQSDGVQASLLAKFPAMLFLPVETGSEGELAAQSRVQMMLVEARTRAQSEFQRALGATRRSLEEIRSYVDQHPELRRAAYHVPHRPGIAGIAANFVLHVHERMRRTPDFRPVAARPPESQRGLP
jgi:predicted nucleotide-binding protein (sugar kinase/HSP70/actin superfamily)